MKIFPTRGGWFRLVLLGAFVAVMMIPVHVNEAGRASPPEPISFAGLSGEHGTWAVAGVMATSPDGTVPLGSKLVASSPWLHTKLSEVRGWVFPNDADDAAVAAGDIRHSNTVSDLIAAGEVRKALGEDSGGNGMFITETDPQCAWFAEGLKEQDIVVSRRSDDADIYAANSALNHGDAPQTLTIFRDGRTFPLTLTQACGHLPLAVPTYVGTAPESSTPGSSGSSRGLITALAMLDATTHGDLTGGKRITGTGELLVGGATSEIAGVQEKVAGANGKYEVFIVDEMDYPLAVEAAQRLGSSISVVRAPTFAEAVAWLCANGGGSDDACRTQ